MQRVSFHRAVIALAALIAYPATADTVTTTTSDGVTLYGETWFADLDYTAPLVLLFHQGGGNARGEYPEIAAWLNDNGFRAVAWDFRSGGDRFDSRNRTVDGIDESVPTGFCDGFPDFEAAVDYVLDSELAETVVAWGSSYSGALVFQLAAARPDEVTSVIVFSPASGGPMQDCKASHWLGDVKAATIVFTPASEMEYAHVADQKDMFAATGAETHVVENGVHGSSMLVDERTGHDMSELRGEVLEWLRETTAGAGAR